MNTHIKETHIRNIHNKRYNKLAMRAISVAVLPTGQWHH